MGAGGEGGFLTAAGKGPPDGQGHAERSSRAPGPLSQRAGRSFSPSGPPLGRF